MTSATDPPLKKNMVPCHQRNSPEGGASVLSEKILSPCSNLHHNIFITVMLISAVRHVAPLPDSYVANAPLPDSYMDNLSSTQSKI